MSNKIWTNKAIQLMFKLLPHITVNNKQVGYFNSSWKTYPPHLNSKEWNLGMEQLLQQLINAEVFQHKKPKSAGAVAMQIQHCVYPAYNPLFRTRRATLRLSAYYSGFMEIRDIARLETPVDPINDI